jgi:multiple sugar transport system permease protein
MRWPKRPEVRIDQLGYVPAGPKRAVWVWGWGDLVFALTLTSDDESKRVVTTGLANFLGAFATDWAGAMAFCSLAMLPPLVVFIFAQRQVIAGLTAGGTKG